MATRKIAMKYDLYQLNNENSPAFGKWFPRAIRNSTLSLRGLADHIANHGSVYTQDVVYGVLTKFKTCLVELIEQGTAVKLDGLGTFYPSIEGKGYESVEDLVANLDDSIRGVHIRFRPENGGTPDEKLTSRVFKDRCVFEAHQLVETMSKTIDGKRKTYQKRTPLATYAIEQAEPDPEPEP